MISVKVKPSKSPLYSPESSLKQSFVKCSFSRKRQEHEIGSEIDDLFPVNISPGIKKKLTQIGFEAAQPLPFGYLKLITK